MKKRGSKHISLHSGLKRRAPTAIDSSYGAGKTSVNKGATRGKKAAHSPRTIGPRTA